MLFLQEKPQLIRLLTLCEPTAVLKEADPHDAPPLRARAKVIESLTEMCRTPAHSYFRSALLSSRPAFRKVVKYLQHSCRLNNELVSSPYSQLFLALCLGPESGSKGFVHRTRRAVYIPGETQEQRRLKRKAVQNGSILIAHLLQERYPDSKEQLSELHESLEDADILYHFMVLLDFITAGLTTQITSPRQATAGSHTTQEDPGSPGLPACSPTRSAEAARKLQAFAGETILSTAGFKSIKAAAEKAVKLNVPKGQAKYAHSYPTCLVEEFTKAESSLGVEYL